MTVDLAARAAEVRRALAAAQATRATIEPCPLQDLADIRAILGTGNLPGHEERADLEREHRAAGRTIRTSGTYLTARWWCRSCSGFVSGESAQCGRCSDRGPHVYGEEAPTTGQAQRRARLRREHRARQTIRR